MSKPETLDYLLFVYLSQIISSSTLWHITCFPNILQPYLVSIPCCNPSFTRAWNRETLNMGLSHNTVSVRLGCYFKNTPVPFEAPSRLSPCSIFSPSVSFTFGWRLLQIFGSHCGQSATRVWYGLVRCMARWLQCAVVCAHWQIRPSWHAMILA